MPRGVYIRTEETRKSLSDASIKWWESHPEERITGNRGGWSKGLTKEIAPELIRSEESREKDRIAHLGNKNALGHTCPQELKDLISKMKIGNNYSLGHIVTEKARNLISVRTKEGMNNPETHRKLSVSASRRFWKGGISRLPYAFEFDEFLKEKIRQRDNYTCQLCGVPECECTEKLSIHHIDYDKENCSEVNLISLCRSCNSKVNIRREIWTRYFISKTPLQCPLQLK